MSFIHDKAIEWQIIGCVLKKPELAKIVVAQLSPPDFYVPRMKLFLRLVTETYEENKNIETFLDEFFTRLKSQNLLDQKTIVLIHDLIDKVITTAGIKNYIDEVKETKIRWRMGELITTLTNNLASTHIPVADSIQAIIDCLNSLDGAAKLVKAPSNLVKEYVEESEGIFSLDDVCKQYRIFDRPGRQAISRVLCRMAEDDIIKRESNRNAVFRRIEKEAPSMDWENATGEPIAFACPLGSDRYARIHTKSIVIIGGSKDAGKTTYALNSALMNIKNFKQIRYVCSEMGANELRDRLELFDMDMDIWKQIDFKSRNRDFADVTLPDGLTIIDFLKIQDNFYLIGKMIDEIYDQLDTGVALICIQKDPKSEYARGGPFSEETARIAITLDPDYPGAVAKINVGKIFAQKAINPKGFTRHYKIVNGSKFICTGGWCSP